MAMPFRNRITCQPTRLTSTTAPAVAQHLPLEFALANIPTVPRGARVKLASHSQVAYLSGSRTTTSTPKTAAAPEKATPVFPFVRSTPTPTFPYLPLSPSPSHDISSHLTYLKLGLPAAPEKAQVSISPLSYTTHTTHPSNHYQPQQGNQSALPRRPQILLRQLTSSSTLISISGCVSNPVFSI